MNAAHSVIANARKAPWTFARSGDRNVSTNDARDERASASTRRATEPSASRAGMGPECRSAGPRLRARWDPASFGYSRCRRAGRSGRPRITSPSPERTLAMPRRVLIMGAAGRDFHNFNVVYRDDPETEVVAF